MLIIITGFLLILAIIFIKYKPVYEVTIAGEKLGYIEKVDEFKNLIEEKIINQEGEYIENISLIQEPEYSFKLLKRTSNLNTDEVIEKLKTADRYATFKTGYQEYYDNGGIILADRYTTANMVHQAGKIYNKEERKKFLDWLWDFEFNLYGLPIPSEVFFLNMPVEKSIELMKNRENKFTHNQAKDIHESDTQHLIDAYRAACDVAKDYNWYEIKCIKEGNLRTIEDIHEEIYNEVKKHI